MNKTTVHKRGDAEPGQKNELYRWNGEFREPKAGEYYLSGAICEAYQAPNDLSYRYHIAVRVDQ